jgi:NAD(P)H-dependent FMN reductase
LRGPAANAEAVARWVYDLATRRPDAEFELVDLAEHQLPLLDEPVPPSMGQYSHEHTRRWAATIAAFNGYVFVTPEYNHSISGALKNALDYLYAEWTNKAAGFVVYGSAGGARAIEQLRLILAELQVATVRAQVGLPLFTYFENFSEFRPSTLHEQTLTTMLDQLVAWSHGMKAVREHAPMAQMYAT